MGRHQLPELVVRPQAAWEDWRKVLHAILGLPAILLAGGWVGAWWLVGLSVVALLAHNLELFGRWLSGFARPSERPWRDGPSCYAYAIIAALLALPEQSAAVAWLALAWGDGLSNLVGRKCPLARLAPGRSLGGALGMLAGSLLGCLVVSGLSPSGLVSSAWVLGFAVGGAAALGEFVAVSWDDNLVVPAVAGLTHWLLSPLVVPAVG